MSIARACLEMAVLWALACGTGACGPAARDPGDSAAVVRRPLLVAAAASTRPAVDALAAELRSTGQAIEVVYGASGQLVAQVDQGARFDVFLGADREHAARLVRTGRAASAFEYGRGQLVIWVREGSPLRPERDGVAVLVDPAVVKVAVANPRLAPYGVAAIAAIEAAGLRGRLESRLVFAENVAQAMHFAASGAADVALVAASLVVGRAVEERGRFGVVAVPQPELLTHSGVVLAPAGADAAARAFVALMVGAAGRRVLAAHGLAAPD